MLGASINNILILLTENFVKLVLGFFGLATPLAWYMMQKWLEDYSYKIALTWDVFIFSGLIQHSTSLYPHRRKHDLLSYHHAVAIALLTISARRTGQSRE